MRFGHVCPPHEVGLVTVLCLCCLPFVSQDASHLPHNPQPLTSQLTGQHLQKNNNCLSGKIFINIRVLMGSFKTVPLPNLFDINIYDLLSSVTLLFSFSNRWNITRSSAIFIMCFFKERCSDSVRATTPLARTPTPPHVHTVYTTTHTITIFLFTQMWTAVAAASLILSHIARSRGDPDIATTLRTLRPWSPAAHFTVNVRTKKPWLNLSTECH